MGGARGRLAEAGIEAGSRALGLMIVLDHQRRL
jgi:hypothetical protein